MIIAIVVVSVVLVLGAAMVAGSVSTSTHATHEYGRADALAAANAGLAAAVHRLSSQAEATATQEKNCFTTEFVAETEKGLCPASGKEAMANGASYKYYVSPVLAEAGNECTGLWVVAPNVRTVKQRCITSIGIAEDKVLARVQERVAHLVVLFPSNGLFSYSTMKFTHNELTLEGELGALGEIKVNNEIENSSPLTINYTTKPTVTCKAECKTSEIKAEALSVPPYLLPKQNPEPYAKSQETNNNANVKLEGAAKIEGVRVLSLGSGTATFPAGTYNFCKITASGGVVKYSKGVKIYVDSSNRKEGTPTSNCSANGEVHISGGLKWEDQATTPTSTDLEIYAWGSPETTLGSGLTKFEITGGAPSVLYAMIYAPYSTFKPTGPVTIKGAVVAGWVEATQALTIVGEGGGSKGGAASFYATAYHQCPPVYEEKKPAVGCY